MKGQGRVGGGGISAEVFVAVQEGARPLVFSPARMSAAGGSHVKGAISAEALWRCGREHAGPYARRLVCQPRAVRM